MKSIKIKKTNDGSLTFYNFEVDETYHSVSGAIEEAFKKFAEPSLNSILALNPDFNKKEEIYIFDPFFGLGYNSLAMLYYLREIFNYEGKIVFVCVEKDKEIISKINSIEFSRLTTEYDVILLDKYYKMIKKLAKSKFLKSQKVFMNLIINDIFNSFSEIEKQIDDHFFDFILFDPFSPKKQPELWSKDLFYKIYQLSGSPAVLTTYSCARIARDNMLKAGFIVKDGPKVGRRSPATIALKNKKDL